MNLAFALLLAPRFHGQWHGNLSCHCRSISVRNTGLHRWANNQPISKSENPIRSM